MPYIRSTTTPVYWAAGDPVLAMGVMDEPGVTITGLTLYSDTSENTFLGKVVGKGASYTPLPTSGWLTAGEFYSYGADIVIVRQSHNRTLFPPATTPALFMFYQVGAGIQAWIVGELVYVGTHRMYNSVEYVCRQQHVTQADWTPPAAITLWQAVVPASPDWKTGVAYKVGDHVLYGGFEWVCGQAHTSIATWYPGAPGVYLWTKI